MTLMWHVLFQNVSTTSDRFDSNEVASIKWLVRRCLSTLSVGMRGKYTNIKCFAVDLPISRQAFSCYFPVDYSNEEKFIKTLSLDKLNGVLVIIGIFLTSRNLQLEGE